ARPRASVASLVPVPKLPLWFHPNTRAPSTGRPAGSTTTTGLHSPGPYAEPTSVPISVPVLASYVRVATTLPASTHVTTATHPSTGGNRNAPRVPVRAVSCWNGPSSRAIAGDEHCPAAARAG